MREKQSSEAEAPLQDLELGICPAGNLDNHVEDGVLKNGHDGHPSSGTKERHNEARGGETHRLVREEGDVVEGRDHVAGSVLCAG